MTKTKIAVMQPYFFPYLGYWQLINAADEFVVYDKIQYTKKGWINRNRYLKNSKDDIFTIPLKKDSDYLNIDEKVISKEFNKKKLISQFQNAYAKAPYKKEILNFIENIIFFENDNLFEYLYNSIIKICNFLDINTKIIISSSVNYNNELKSEAKVIDIVKHLNGTQYINAIGGIELYNKDNFKKNGIDLNFIQMKNIQYKQFNNEFIPNLSIIDVLMFNPLEKVKEFLDEYELI